MVVAEEGGGELVLLAEEDKLAGLDVDVREEDDEYDEGVDKGVEVDDNDDAPEGKEDVGTEAARTATSRRTRMASAHMDVKWCLTLWTSWGEQGKGETAKGRREGIL